MKPLGAKGSEKRKVSLRSHLSEPIDRVNRDNARASEFVTILALIELSQNSSTLVSSSM
jgi:hypothetical protein